MSGEIALILIRRAFQTLMQVDIMNMIDFFDESTKFAPVYDATPVPF